LPSAARIHRRRGGRVAVGGAGAAERIGCAESAAHPAIAVFRERLAMLGWVEGGNLRMDYRFAGGDPDPLAAYAEELVNLRPDLIFAFNGQVARAFSNGQRPSRLFSWAVATRPRVVWSAIDLGW
jgi:hypothetical protein